MSEIIQMQTTAGVDFAFHFEGSKIIIDRCKGISVEYGLSMFPQWVIKILAESEKR